MAKSKATHGITEQIEKVENGSIEEIESTLSILRADSDIWASKALFHI